MNLLHSDLLRSKHLQFTISTAWNARRQAFILVQKDFFHTFIYLHSLYSWQRYTRVSVKYLKGKALGKLKGNMRRSQEKNERNPWHLLCFHGHWRMHNLFFRSPYSLFTILIPAMPAVLSCTLNWEKMAPGAVEIGTKQSLNTEILKNLEMLGKYHWGQ